MSERLGSIGTKSPDLIKGVDPIKVVHETNGTYTISGGSEGKSYIGVSPIVVDNDANTVALTSDDTPTEGSTNTVTSGGVYDAIKNASTTVDPDTAKISSTDRTLERYNGADVDGFIVKTNAAGNSISSASIQLQDISNNFRVYNGLANLGKDDVGYDLYALANHSGLSVQRKIIEVNNGTDTTDSVVNLYADSIYISGNGQDIAETTFEAPLSGILGNPITLTMDDAILSTSNNPVKNSVIANKLQMWETVRSAGVNVSGRYPTIPLDTVVTSEDKSVFTSFTPSPTASDSTLNIETNFTGFPNQTVSFNGQTYPLYFTGNYNSVFGNPVIVKIANIYNVVYSTTTATSWDSSAFWFAKGTLTMSDEALNYVYIDDGYPVQVGWLVSKINTAAMHTVPVMLTLTVDKVDNTVTAELGVTKTWSDKMNVNTKYDIQFFNSRIFYN